MSEERLRPTDPGKPPAEIGAVVTNPWHTLRRFTPARIALGRAGISLPTAAQLDFQLAHAQARDAVHRPLDTDALCDEVEQLGLKTLPLHSAAASRTVYLQRPDLGRRLGEQAVRRLSEPSAWPAAPTEGGATRLVIVIADGLSALAVQRHAAPLVAALQPLLAPAEGAAGWSLGPVAVVEQGRVAIGDGIGEALGAEVVVVLIGERPGLSSPDSLGIYLTWAPRTGCSDAERNCISNVRPAGLACGEAAARLAWLLHEARRRRLSGVALKDERAAPEAAAAERPNFLLADGASAAT